MYYFKKETFGESGTFVDNFLWNNNQIYVMDNHRLAAWCWAKHFSYEDELYLFHIDRHYDCCRLSEKEIKKLGKVNLKEITLEDYREITCNYDGGELVDLSLIRWDNYISLFSNYFNIKKAMFLTHQDGGDLFWNDYNEETPFILIDNIDYCSKKEKNMILNIDLDYFFCDIDESSTKLLSEDYIRGLFKKIKIMLDQNTVKVLTIALSPEFCGGWKNAIDCFEIVRKELNLDIQI